MKAKAEAHGAVTVVNALASGKGAALGIDLKVEAEVELLPNQDIDVIIEGNHSEDQSLAKAVVSEIFMKYNITGCGAKVITHTNIPIARGLKSSSSASNAIALATLAAMGKKIDDLSIVSMAVDASLKAGVTITGAFDDATASYFGGLVVTNNYEKRILRRTQADSDLHIVIFVPERRVYTKSIDTSQLSKYAPIVDRIWELAYAGRFWEALTLNGLVYSTAFGYDTDVVSEAISAGALAAGMSGKGPAVVAVCLVDKVDKIASVWSNLEGSVLKSRVNNEKARVMQNWL